MISLFINHTRIIQVYNIFRKNYNYGDNPITPIITSKDEIDLSRLEDELVDTFEDHAKAQRKVIKRQKQLADEVADMNISRGKLNRTMRDVFKQMKMLAREHKSNVKEKDVNLLKELIKQSDQYRENTNKFVDAIKELALKKEYLTQKQDELAEAMENMADERESVIKKALEVEKVKNKMADQSELDKLDQELNDQQRRFDRARDIFLKKIEQFMEVRQETNQLWIELKNAISEMS
jgi:hypothetical protein